jgi:NADH dehydrogenase [ubiquinone] 1 alpha subcomplex assembly factor 7
VSAAPLKDILARLIAAEGPISVAHYMAESNARYYAARDPLGAAGDFVTAPEISQMFGELIGLWLADLWQRAGRPEPSHYVELGPGRGTLARDALRSAARHGFSPQVHLVETSPALIALQRAAFPQARWHHDVSTLPGDGPLLMVANEFLDALPVRQLVRTPAGWRERMIGLEDGWLAFVAGDRPMDAALSPDRPDVGEGAILETSPGAAAVVRAAAERVASQGGAALFVDYGHVAPRTGSTLQAVRAHRSVGPLDSPGEADLTVHVDFAVLSQVARQAGRGSTAPLNRARSSPLWASERGRRRSPGPRPSRLRRCARPMIASSARGHGAAVQGRRHRCAGLAATRRILGAPLRLRQLQAGQPHAPKLQLASGRALSIRPAKRGTRARPGRRFFRAVRGQPDALQTKRRGRTPRTAGVTTRVTNGTRGEHRCSGRPRAAAQGSAASGTDLRRRDFINIAAVTFAGIGGAATLYPLVSQMAPSADVLAESSTEIDLSAIQPGQSIKAVFRKQPLFVRHLTPAEMAAARKVDVGDCAIPRRSASGPSRARRTG